MKKQVNRGHYRFFGYIHEGRWNSYYHQIREILSLDAKTLLEIGGGPGVLKSVLEATGDIDYFSVDIADDLKPDFLGSADNLPLGDSSYDLVVAFQVLEHLPFDKFEASLGEIARVSKKYAIISLPHWGPQLRFLIKIPLIPEIKFHTTLRYGRKHVLGGEHYWEIGKKGYSPKKVRDCIKKKFHILKEFQTFNYQYHHFFVLENK